MEQERLTKLFCTVNSNRKTTRHFMLPAETGDIKHQRKMVDKLGQLEDIEEELGIDLITLAKALKKGIYVKDGKCVVKVVIF